MYPVSLSYHSFPRGLRIHVFFGNEVIQFLFEEVTQVVCESHSSNGVTLF